MVGALKVSLNERKKVSKSNSIDGPARGASESISRGAGGTHPPAKRYNGASGAAIEAPQRSITFNLVSCERQSEAEKQLNA